MQPEQIIMTLFGLLSTIAVGLAAWGLKRVERVDKLEGDQSTLLANQARLNNDQKELENHLKTLIHNSTQTTERLTSTLGQLTAELQLVRLQLNGPTGSTGMNADLTKVIERQHVLERDISMIEQEVNRLNTLLETPRSRLTSGRKR